VNQRLKLEMTEEKDNQTAQVRPIETKLKKRLAASWNQESPLIWRER
jgi:hypothetical protein